MSKVRLTFAGRSAAPTRSVQHVATAIGWIRLSSHLGATIAGSRVVRWRSMSNDAEPSPSTTAAWSTAVGTPDVEQDRGRPPPVRPGAATASRRRGAARRGRRCAAPPAPGPRLAKCVAASRSRSAKPGRSSIECTRYHATSTPPRARRDVVRAVCDVPDDDLDLVGPRPVVERAGPPGQHPDLPALRRAAGGRAARRHSRTRR